MPLYIWMYHISFIHALTDGHLGCFSYFLAIMNNVVVKIPLQVLCAYVFISLEYTVGSGGVFACLSIPNVL